MEKIVNWVGKDPLRADALVELVLQNQKLIAQRASWPMGPLAILHPELIIKHLQAIVQFIQKPKLHAAIKRNLLRFLEKVDLPEALQCPVMDLCFRIVESPDEPPACKAFAMGNLHRLSLQYPDILPEIRSLLEGRLLLETPAFKARAKLFLKKTNAR